MNNYLELMKNFINDLPIGIAKHDINAQEKSVYNNYFLDMFGWSLHEIDTLSKWLQKAYPDSEYRKKIINIWSNIDENDIEKNSSHYVLPKKVEITCKDGHHKWVEVRYYKKKNFVYIVFQDITESYKSEERLRFALSGASDGLWDWNLETNEVYFSPRWFSLLGYKDHELETDFKTWEKLMDPDQIEPTLSLIEKYLAGKSKKFETEFRMKHKDGHWVHILSRARLAFDEEGNILVPKRLVGTHVDISQQKQYQQQLEYMAHYDVLTSLPNRYLLSDRIQQSIGSSKRNGDKIVVIYLDLDGFKAINDKYGHDFGDKVLISTAQNLRLALREGDSLARLGGDEFVISLVGLKDINASIPVIKRVLDSVLTPMKIDNLDFNISASLGVTYYPQDEEVDADQLIRQADQAMYMAKKNGKNCFKIFDNKYETTIRDNHEKLKKIKEALKNDEFELYYQPKVNLYTGVVVGLEALIRWNHPQKGILPPIDFLPLLDNKKEMVEIGEFVINKAMAQIEIWKEKGINLQVSVNIDAFHLQQSNFLERIQEILKMYPKVKAEDIELEIVETSALKDIESISKIMHKCQELGFSFAIDDFGTGYSSLVYLKQLPAKTLKIDKSFVIDMLDDTDDLAILEGVLGLSNVFGRRVIAEGVESNLHGEFLLRMGCRVAQGYAIAKPMPADLVQEWIEVKWEPYPKHLHLKSLNREEISSLYAAIEHRVWVNKFISYLKDEVETPPISNIEAHHFEQWLKRGNLTLANTLHDKMHTLVDKLTKKHKEGKSKWVKADIAEILELRDTFVRTILDLLYKVK